jgi:hypothetical protein
MNDIAPRVLIASSSSRPRMHSLENVIEFASCMLIAIEQFASKYA